MRVDFFARFPHYIDHLAPIWLELDPAMRGDFVVPVVLMDHARQRGIGDYGLVGYTGSANHPYEVPAPKHSEAIVTCGYKDLMQAAAANNRRKNIFLQHGVGLSFSNSDGYAGGAGFQKNVSLFLHPNEHTKRLVEARWPNKKSAVVGTPKLDRFKTAVSASLKKGAKPIVAISFHWDGKAIAPEAGNAFEHYKRVLPQLADCEQFTLLGHGHPRIFAALEKYYAGWGIETARDFDEVMERADIYINDCSSTMYEFCVTGKPVIILNAPWFRRNVHHGLRFWEYADVGIEVNKPENLLPAILHTLDAPDEHRAEREKAAADLYPFHGQAAKRAAEAIEKYIEELYPEPKPIVEVQDQSVGLVYMGFGEKAAHAIRLSEASLRRRGVKMNACVVGNHPVAGLKFIRWDGEYPFDAAQAKNFQFRAGRVKPFLYSLSPFERTLYIDADTEFMGDILPAFECLGEFDLAIAHELLKVKELYNKPLAGWEINVVERDATIQEIGANRDTYFLNSGVIFFRKSKAAEKVFTRWGEEWKRWSQWDEQLALMRALHSAPEAKLKILPPEWNHPHRGQAKIIFHNYGRGVCRSNVA